MEKSLRERRKARFRVVSPQEASTHHEKLKDVFKLITEKSSNSSDSGFSVDKETILKVFKLTNSTTKADILARLTLIDSMYSTQMNRRYYALDELADFLVNLSEGKDGKLKQMFLDFAKEPEEKLFLFNYVFKERNEKGEFIEVKKNLFSENYGIGKDGSEKGIAISLISKYGYFETECKFPIYDSIACEMFPLVWICCGFDKNMPKLIRYNKDDGRIIGHTTLVEYIKAINLLIKKLDSCYVNYDSLDYYLWSVGKICRGNLSLILSRKEYKDAVEKCPPQPIIIPQKDGSEKKVMEYFNIENIKLDKLDFLKEKPLLDELFKLAKYYRSKK